MIELEQERLPLDVEKRLRRWLALPEAAILRRVIYARCQFHQAEALEKALTATGVDADALLATDSMKQGKRYHDFLTILSELSDAPTEEHFHTAKLKSATTNANTTEPERDET